MQATSICLTSINVLTKYISTRPNEEEKEYRLRVLKLLSSQLPSDLNALVNHEAFERYYMERAGIVDVLFQATESLSRLTLLKELEALVPEYIVNLHKSMTPLSDPRRMWTSATLVLLPTLAVLEMRELEPIEIFYPGYFEQLPRIDESFKKIKSYNSESGAQIFLLERGNFRCVLKSSASNYNVNNPKDVAIHEKSRLNPRAHRSLYLEAKGFARIQYYLVKDSKEYFSDENPFLSIYGLFTNGIDIMMLMEDFPGGVSVLDYFLTHTLEEKEVKELARQFYAGLTFFYDHGMIPDDLHTGNLLTDGKKVKFIDFNGIIDEDYSGEIENVAKMFRVTPESFSLLPKDNGKLDYLLGIYRAANMLLVMLKLPPLEIQYLNQEEIVQEMYSPKVLDMIVDPSLKWIIEASTSENALERPTPRACWDRLR